MFMSRIVFKIMFDLQLIRKKMVKSAKEGMKMQATNSEIYGRMHAVFIEMEGASSVSPHFIFMFNLMSNSLVY